MRNINKKREKNKQQKKRNKRTEWKKYTGFVVLGNIKKNRRTAQRYETEIEISAINCHQTLPYNM